MERAYLALPPPIPSIAVRDEEGNEQRIPESMSAYHNRDAGCFAAGCPVKLVDSTMLAIERLRPEMILWTPRGGRKVSAIVESAVLDAEMCRIGDLLITPWHPIRVGGAWAFPADITDSAFRYRGKVYAILLELDENENAHAVIVGGVLAVTSGHGVTAASGCRDVRAHKFFGDYMAVQRAIEGLSVRNGVYVSLGMQRDGANG